MVLLWCTKVLPVFCVPPARSLAVALALCARDSWPGVLPLVSPPFLFPPSSLPSGRALLTPMVLAFAVAVCPRPSSNPPRCHTLAAGAGFIPPLLRLLLPRRCLLVAEVLPDFTLVPCALRPALALGLPLRAGRRLRHTTTTPSPPFVLPMHSVNTTDSCQPASVAAFCWSVVSALATS